MARTLLSREAGTAAYIDAAVAGHLAPTIALRAEADATSVRIARRFDLDVMDRDLEDAVLTRVFAGMTVDELERAIADPSRRSRARAELARRSA